MLRFTTLILLFVSIVATEIETALATSFLTANLKTSDLAYSSVTGQVYAAVPNASLINPNTLTPINPNTATLGTSIPIGFDPARVAVSSDGNNLFTVIGGLRAVQRYNIPSATADQLTTVPGGPQITEMYTVPGRPNAILLHLASIGSSPPAVETVILENAVVLPDQVGHGLGVGGPDIFAVDPTDGTKAYGYQNSVSSFDNVPLLITPTGLVGNGPATLGGVLTGNIGHIAIVGDRLFDNLGQIFSLSLGFQVGSFVGGGNFLLDPSLHKFYSVTTSGSNQTINAYSLDTLALIGTTTLSGISGSTSSLTRFGFNGLAFRTSSDQVIFVQSSLVPEPSAFALAAFGFAGLAAWRYRRRRA